MIRYYTSRVKRIKSFNSPWGVEGFNPFNPGGIVANHIAAGLMGIIGGIFHITNRPGERLYRALKLGSLEGVLASALAAVLFVSFVNERYK